MRFYLNTVLLTALPLIAAAVLERRHRLCGLIRQAIDTSGLERKQVAGELGRDQSHLNRLLDEGTFHVADLFSLPEPARSRAIDEVLFAEGVLTVSAAVRSFGKLTERRLLDLLPRATSAQTPSVRSIRRMA